MLISLVILHPNMVTLEAKMFLTTNAYFELNKALAETNEGYRVEGPDYKVYVKGSLLPLIVEFVVHIGGDCDANEIIGECNTFRCHGYEVKLSVRTITIFPTKKEYTCYIHFVNNMHETLYKSAEFTGIVDSFWNKINDNIKSLLIAPMHNNALCIGSDLVKIKYEYEGICNGNAIEIMKEAIEVRKPNSISGGKLQVSAYETSGNRTQFEVTIHV
jgi:hypothetical protein